MRQNRLRRRAAHVVVMMGLVACGEEEGPPEAAPMRDQPEASPSPPTSDELPPPPPPVGPNFGRTTVHPGFMPDPMVVTGTSGGALDAEERFGAPCAGFVTENEDHELVVDGTFAELRVLVDADADLTLVVDGPRGPDAEVRCGDDEAGELPLVRGAFAEGVYRVWVGSKAPRLRHRYRLAFSEIDLVDALAVRRARLRPPGTLDEDDGRPPADEEGAP